MAGAENGNALQSGAEWVLSVASLLVPADRRRAGPR